MIKIKDYLQTAKAEQTEVERSVAADATSEVPAVAVHRVGLQMEERQTVEFGEEHQVDEAQS